MWTLDGVLLSVPLEKVFSGHYAGHYGTYESDSVICKYTPTCLRFIKHTVYL